MSNYEPVIRLIKKTIERLSHGEDQYIVPTQTLKIAMVYLTIASFSTRATNVTQGLTSSKPACLVKIQPH